MRVVVLADQAEPDIGEHPDATDAVNMYIAAKLQLAAYMTAGATPEIER